MSKNTASAKSIARYGISFALIFVARMLDRLISMAWPINLAVVTIIVSFTLILLSRNIWEALLMGALFGTASLIAAIIFPSPAFMLPWVSILPRIIVGVAVFAVYKLMFGLLGKVGVKKRRYFSAFAATAVGVMVNTITVMFMLSVNGGDMQGYFAAIEAILLTNFVPELAVAVVAVPPLVLGVAAGAHMRIAGESKE